MRIVDYIEELSKGKGANRPLPLFGWLTTIDANNGVIPRQDIKAASDLTHANANTITVAVASQEFYRQTVSIVRFRVQVNSTDKVARHIAARLMTVLSWRNLGIQWLPPVARRQPVRPNSGIVIYQVEWSMLLANDDTDLDERNPAINPIILSITFLADPEDTFRAPDHTVAASPRGDYTQ